MNKIMVIEDNKFLRVLYKQVLEENGFKIIAAKDARHALKLLERHQLKPEIILLDYRLPTIDGFELSKKILAKEHSLKILMISGDPRINEERASSLGIRFRKKPISLSELLMEIESLMVNPVAE